MDSTDVRIFCEMAFQGLTYSAYSNRHPSPADIGKKLGLDEKTVRLRVRRMEDSGFVKYYQVMPNIALFGLRSMASYRFQALNLSTKFALLDRVHEIPGLIETLDYLGPFLSADLAGASTEDAHGAAKKLARKYELDMFSLGNRVVREPLAKLDRLDWRIIRQLRYDARLETKEIAKTLSTTPRMAGYRISKLLNSGAVSIRAVIDPRKQAGLVFYDLEVATNEENHPRLIRSLRERFGEKLWYIKNPSPGVTIASLFSFTLEEPEESVRGTLGIEEVRRCSLFILKEVIEPRRLSWVDNLIESKISS